MAPQQVNSPDNSAPRSSSEVNDTRMVAVSGRPLYERHTPNQRRCVHQFYGRRYRTILCGDKFSSANRCYTAIDRRTNSLVQVGTPLFLDLPLRFLQAQASPPPWFHSIPPPPLLTRANDDHRLDHRNSREGKYMSCLTWSMHPHTRQRGRVSPTCSYAFPPLPLDSMF